MLPIMDFLSISHLFKQIFLFNDDVASILRDNGYEGEIMLFSSFQQLAYPGFFQEFDLIPVVTGKENYNKAVENNLNPLYMISDKRCVAEYGLCANRRGDIQYFYDCDCRCRDKSVDKVGVDFPLSIRPDMTIPDGVSGTVFYSEKLSVEYGKTGELNPSILNSAWNYLWPLGRKILKPGKFKGDNLYHFTLDKESAELFENGLICFWGYRTKMYQGKTIQPRKVTLKGDKNLLVHTHTTYEKLLLIQQYTSKEKEMLKSARHFIFTMPESKFIDIPENGQEPEQQEGSKKSIQGRKRKVTLIIDNLDRAKIFKGRDVERIVMRFSRALPKMFPHYIFASGALEIEDVEFISHMKKLKGIVVPNGVMKIMFERIFNGEKEILLYPTVIRDKKKAPIFLSSSLPVFTSRFISDNRKDYRWPSLNIYLKNHKNYSEFYTRKRTVVTGGKHEVWVDLMQANDKQVAYLKSEVERLIRMK